MEALAHKAGGTVLRGDRGRVTSPLYRHVRQPYTPTARTTLPGLERRCPVLLPAVQRGTSSRRAGRVPVPFPSVACTSVDHPARARAGGRGSQQFGPAGALRVGYGRDGTAPVRPGATAWAIKPRAGRAAPPLHRSCRVLGHHRPPSRHARALGSSGARLLTAGSSPGAIFSPPGMISTLGWPGPSSTRKVRSSEKRRTCSPRKVTSGNRPFTTRCWLRSPAATPPMVLQSWQHRHYPGLDSTVVQNLQHRHHPTGGALCRWRNSLGDTP